MNPEISLRQMTPADLPFADSLRALAGWNQKLDDWERLLALSMLDSGFPQSDGGCFIAEWQGSPVGTATTTCYGNELAWIGMVLVHPDFRARGLGRALLNRCLEYLHQRGIRCIKLDATSQGKLLYDQLGFREEWPLTRWQCRNLQMAIRTPINEIRAYVESDADAVEQSDTRAFGVSRRPLLQSLLGNCVQALVHQNEDGIAGYGVLREGSRAYYLGPLVAEAASSGTLLVNALLARAIGKTIFWDIPDANSEAVALAKELGFTAQRQLVRMWLGVNARAGEPRRCFGIADPAVG